MVLKLSRLGGNGLVGIVQYSDMVRTSSFHLYLYKYNEIILLHLDTGNLTNQLEEFKTHLEWDFCAIDLNSW